MVSGGFLSGSYKFVDIVSDCSPKYQYSLVEFPMRGVYHASIIAAHIGWGGIVGGFAAATAPISIPTYIWINR